MRLISKIYKEVMQLNITKTTTIKKWAEALNRNFCTDGQQTPEKMPKSLIIREMQVKTTVSYHITSMRMAIIEKTRNKCWRRCGKEGTLVCGVIN